MTTQRISADPIPTEHLARAIAAASLAAIAVIHLIDLPDTMQATPLIGYGYLLVIAAALVGGATLMTLPGPRAWLLADLIAVGAIVAYVLSRTTGLPTDNLDLGNWDCALGIAALSTESIVVLLASWRLQPQRSISDAETSAGRPTVGASADHTHLRHALQHDDR